MKNSITLIFILLLTISGFPQEKHSRVRVYLEGATLADLAALHVDVHEGTYKKGVFFETDYAASEIERIRQAGFRIDLLIDDVQQYYRDRAYTEQDLPQLSGQEWEVPENWEYGTMGGYHTLDEAMATLDSMHARYPGLITARMPLSEDTLSHEGRKQWWVRISDNAATDEDEPEVLYTGVHHAREVITVSQTLFYMWYLLEHYDSDPEIKYIVDNTELCFVPVLNPDGYQYNVTTNPDGGGMWRKNRRDNGDGSYGVDPNRNYGYQWGLDDNGSSPWPEDATYRGPAPFSEPENKNIRDFCNAHDFQIALNYHSYSNLLLSPWGYTDEHPEDHELLLDFAGLMTYENNYTFGSGNTTIYPTNGGSDDWMYGEQDTKDKIFSYTPEVGGGTDGFWPVFARIIPLCQEQMWQNITAARLVGKYALATDISPLVTGEPDNYASFEIKRMGLMDTETFTISIEPVDAYIIEVGDPVEFNDMELLASAVDSIPFLLDGNIEEGTEFSYLLKVSNGEITLSDTITRIYGTEVVVFSDACETMDNWNSTYWDVTDEDAYSPDFSITDSPGGNYADNRTSLILLDTTISLAGAKKAFLRFAARWEIEQGYDYVQVMARNAIGGTWEPLKGKYTVTGNTYQDNGSPLYDGSSDWVIEEIDLEEYLEEEVQFRFFFRSDYYVNEDGFYFDDFVVSVISNITGINPGQDGSGHLFLSDAYPNPARDRFSVQYEVKDNAGARLELMDAVGNRLHEIELSDNSGVAVLNLHGYASGVYYLRLLNGPAASEVKKVVKF